MTRSVVKVLLSRMVAVQGFEDKIAKVFEKRLHFVCISVVKLLVFDFFKLKVLFCI